MTAIQTAANTYRDFGLNIAEDIQCYMMFGYVICTPKTFCLFRPIRKEDPDTWIDPKDANAWYVHMLAGDSILNIFKQMPYHLPFCAWYRGFKKQDSKLHIYKTDALKSKIRK